MLSMSKGTAWVFVMGWGAMVAGVAVGAESMGSETTTASARDPGKVRAEDLGYTARMGPIQELDAKRPGVVAFNVYFSAKDAAAWKGSMGEQTMYVDTGATLLKAQTEDGASHKLQSGPWAEIGPGLKFHELDLGGAGHHLTALEFEVPMVKVTQWRTITTKKEAPDAEEKNGEPIDCGAFQICLGGTTDTFHVLAGAMGGFETSRKAYAAKVPLGFLNHGYAMSALEARDGEGKAISYGVTTMTGGASVRSYPGPELVTTQRADGGLAFTGAIVPAKKIIYPVTVTLRMPEKWEKQRVVFRLGEEQLK
jgi:hypothetical protein